MGVLWIQTKDASQHLTGHRTAPQHRALQSQMPMVLSWRNLEISKIQPLLSKNLVSHCCSTTKPVEARSTLEPVFCNKTICCNEKPMHSNEK